MRDDHERLLDILEAIEKIEKGSPQDREALDANEMVQVWILYHLRIIGEAVRALSTEFRDSHPEFPWSGVIGMRNILVHHYFEIDTDIVWSVLQTNLPDLKVKILYFTPVRAVCGTSLQGGTARSRRRRFVRPNHTQFACRI